MEDDELLNLPEDTALAASPLETAPVGLGDADDLSNLPEDTAFNSLLIQEADAIGMFTPPPVQNVGQYVPDDFGKYKQDYNITLPGQLDDLGEYRGATQSNLDKWTNGSIKFVGKTGVNVIGSIPGLGYGLFAGIRDGKFNSLYNNEFARGLDDLNAAMDEALPNHYTQFEREKGLWDQMGTANFWSDKFLNGMSFLAGAVATEFIMSAATAATFGAAAPAQAAATASLLARGTRLFKNTTLGRKATDVASAAGQFVSRRQLLDTGKLTRQLATGAVYEAGVEARHAYDGIKENLVNVAIEKKGLDPYKMTKEQKFEALSIKERQNIENEATNLSNGVFAGNVALVGMSNMLMIPKLYGLGKHNLIRKIPGAESLGEGLAKVGNRARKYIEGKAGKRAADIGYGVGYVAGRGFYEGVIEEGGQGVMQRAAADYALLSGVRDDNSLRELLGSSISSFKEAGAESYFTDEGLTEVVLGVIMGTLGLPGVNTTAIQAYKDTKVRREALDYLDAAIENNPGLIRTLSSNAAFFMNVAKRSKLMDQAIEAGDMALAKDLEYDNFYDYVMAKIATEQYEDIENQTDAILNMAEEEFIEWGGYQNESLTSEEISKRKHHVVNAVKERAAKIKERVDKVDSTLRYTMQEKFAGIQRPGTKAYNRNLLIHSLSTMDNTEEREEALIKKWAELTNGTMTVPSFRVVDNKLVDLSNIESMPVIEYQDADGNLRTVDIAAFTEESGLRGMLANVLKGIEVLEKKGDKTAKENASLKDLYDMKVSLNDIIKTVGDENNLSKEEYEQLIEPWIQADPEGYAQNSKEAYTILADLRKLRARRQTAAEMYKQLMDPYYRPQVTQNIIEKINALDTEVTEGEKEARKRKDEEDARKVQEFKDKLQATRVVTERELENLEKRIEDLKQELKDILGELVQNVESLEAGKRIRGKNGRFLSVRDANKKIEDIEETIRIGESILKDLNIDKDNIVSILTIIDEFELNPPDINQYYAEMYGKSADLLAQIDPSKSIKDLNLQFLRDMTLLKDEKQVQVNTINQAIQEITNELIQLNDYKKVLEDLINQHRKAFKDNGRLTIEEQDNIEFLTSELILTEQSINRLKEILPVDINALDSVAPFVETLKQFEDTATRLFTAAIIKNTKIKKGTDADPKRPSDKYQYSVEDAYSSDYNIPLAKPDISFPGFNKTAGRHKADEDKEVYDAALETYRELVDVDNKTEEEEKKFAIAESQLRWFNWLHSTNISPNISKGKTYHNYALAAIHINNIPDELRKLGLTEELFYDENDIKLVAFQRQKPGDKGKGFDRVNAFVTDKNGNLIFTSAMTSRLDRANGESRFRNDKNIKESEREAISEKHESWRKETLESSDIYLYNITGKSNGKIVLEDEATQNNKKLHGQNRYSEVPLFIGTAKTIDEPITLTDIPMPVFTRSGLVWAYDKTRQMSIPMIGRELDSTEVENVARLLHKLLSLRKEYYDAQEGTKSFEKAYTDAKEFEFELDGKKISLKKAIDDIIYMRGKKSKRDNPQFQLIFSKGKFVFGEESQEIELENFEAGVGDEVYDSFIAFLGDKYHNVSKSSITNGKQDGYVQVILGEDLNLDKDKSTVWKNYNEYLLKDRDEGTSPLLTRVTPINSNTDPDVLDAPRSFGGYATFTQNNRQTLEDIRSLRGRARRAGRDAVTRTSKVVRDTVNQTLDNLGITRPGEQSEEGPEYDQNGNPIMDITDLQPKPEEEPTYNPPADLQYVDIAIDRLSPEETVEILNDPEESKALQERILDRYMDGNLSDEQIKAIEENQDDDGVAPPSTDPNDVPFLTSSYTLPSDKYIEETFGEELRRIQEMLGLELGKVDPKTGEFTLTGKRVAGLISVIGAEGYAMLSDFGKVVVSELAPGGALYHEGFHNVSLHILSPRDRQKVYGLVRRIKGKAIPYQEIAKGEQDRSYKPVSKPLSEFTNTEAEEWLAEEFRRYALSKGTYSIGQDTITEEQKGFFESVFDFIRDAIRYVLRKMRLGRDLTPNEMSVEAMESIDALFNKISSGGFKNAQRNLENKNVGSPMMAASMILNGQSAVFSADLNSTLTAYLAGAIQGVTYETEDGTATLDFSDFLDMTPAKTAALSQAYRNAWADMYDAYTERLESLREGTPEYNQVLGAMKTLYSTARGSKTIKGKVYDLGTENRYEATMIHQQFLKQMGIDLETEDERDEDEVSSRMFQDIADNLEMSPTDTAKGVIKVILGTIPNRTGEYNSTGLRGAYELKSVLKTLQTKLQGTLNFQDQLDKLEDLEEEYPWVNDVIERLGEDPYVMPMSFTEALLQTAFRNQFAKTMYDTQYTILQETGRIYNIDPNLERNLRGIRARWNASLRGKTRTSKHVKFDERGNIVFDKDVKSKFGNRNLTVKEVLNAVEKSRDYSYKLDALEHLGIVFSNREKLEQILQADSNNEMMLPGTDTTYRNAVDNGLAFVFGDIIGGTTSLTALFDRSESLSVTRMNHLAKLELDTTNIEYEFQHQNPEGKLVYSISMNNYMSTIANTPIEEMDDYYSSEQNPNKNPYAFNSLTLKALREDPGARMDVMIREGLAIEGAGQVGVKTSKLRPTDNLASYIESIMQGVMPVLKAADIATDFSIRFPIQEFNDIRSAKEAMLGYLVDEIVATNTATEEQVDVKDYTDRIGRLRMFEGLMSKLNTDMRGHLNNMLNNPEATREDIQEFVTLNGEAFFESIEKVLKEDAQELIEFMDTFKVVSKNEDGTYQLFGLNRERFGDTLPDNVSAEKLQEFAEKVIIRQTIYKNEMFKMFFGDPAFYKALFKRVKGAVGVKDIFNVDPGLINWLNTSDNNREQFDGKKSNGFENLVVVEEPTRITPFLKEYINSLSPEVAEAYAKAADKADGSLLLTLPAYREMAFQGNTWSAEQERVYENIMYRGDAITEEKMGKFPPLKFQYFGYLANANINTQVPGFFKMSAAPIYPQLGKMGNKTFTGIENMYNFLTGNSLGGIILPSAFKIGVPGEDSQMKFMEDGVILDPETLSNILDPKSVVNMDYRFMGTQMEVPSKFKGTSPIATQARVQILSDLYEGGSIREEFKLVEPTVERYNNVLNSLTEQAYKQLLDEFGIKENGRNEDGTINYTVENNDYSKFIETVKNESLRRQMPKQLLASLDYLEQRNDDKKPIYFDAVSNKGRLEGVLWSLAGKRVIRQRFKGDMYVQQSSLGFETARIDGIAGVQLDELAPYTEGDKYMEVYLPHHFTEMVDTDMEVRQDGIYSNGVKVGELNLLEIIGIRIPTDGIHSIEAIKVKGFLPRTAGPTVVIPSEMVTKSGSDFDIDKLVLYFPAYRMRGDELVKEEFVDSLEEWYAAEQDILERNMKALEEMESVMDSVEERDQIVKMLTDSFVSKIFGEELADEVFAEFAEDMSIEQADRLAQYFDSNPEEVRKTYTRIKKIIEKKQVFSKSFEEWQAENPDATIYNVQSRGALQNAVMEDMITLLQINDEERYDTWLQPVNTNDLDSISEEIMGLYEGTDLLPDLSSITDYHKDTNIPNLIRVAEAFNKGKVIVGIAALASTHHIKGQIAGLTLDTDNEIKIATGATKEVRINFPGFDQLAIEQSLSRVKNINDTMRISDAISQFVNGSVDVVNNPILHILNISPDNANMWMFLTRVGVDLRTQAMFANQPIVKDYLQMLEIGRSRTSKVMENDVYDEDIAKQLGKKYATDFKTPEGMSDTYLLDAELLRSMVAKDVEDMTDEEKYIQLQALSDMFLYSKIGESLGNIVTAQAFDTKIPKSRNHLRVAMDMYESALSTGLFKNAEKITGLNTTQPAQQSSEVKVVKVYHHTSVLPQDFNFGNFQRGKNQVSQFGDGLNAATETNEFFTKKYGQPIEGEVNDKDFVEIDANLSESEIYDYLIGLGYKINTPQFKSGKYNSKSAKEEYDGVDPANNDPSVINLFNDFQQSNPNVKGVKVVNHIIGGSKVKPFYVIYDPKSFYGPNSLTKKPTQQASEVTDTFMRSMSTYNYDMQTIFNDLFLTEEQQTAYMADFKRVQRIFTDPNIKGLSVDDRARILSKYENGFISFIMQNLGDINLGDNIESLMFGNDSMAMQLETIQNPKANHPLKDNPFIQNLIPVMSPIRKGKDMTNDYLQPLSRTMTPFEMNSIYDGFREVEATDPNLARNIIKTALLQTGIETGRDSFLNTIPGDSIMRLMEDTLDRYATGNAGMVFNGKIEDYFEYFFENSQGDYNVVPKDNKYSRKIYPYTYRISKDSKKNFKVAIERGMAAPKIEREFMRNPLKDEEGTPQPISMRGSRNLVNMTDRIFLPSNYRKANFTKTVRKKGQDDITCKK
jgi:hypothetical protein